MTICVASFGGREWQQLAESRAVPSAVEQAPVVRVHLPDGDLTDARNAALEQVQTEWVIYLDADDELEPGYVEAMSRGTADVRGPVARYMRGGQGRLWQPRVHGHDHDCAADCLKDGNWLLIGSCVRTEILAKAGGWDDFPVYEDWALWLKVWKLGATFELIPDAIYRAHVRPDSRNRGPSTAEKNRVHHEIVAAILPDARPRRSTGS